MMLPDYWLQRPAIVIDPQTRSEFDQLLARARAAGTNTQIDYTLPAPKWQFCVTWLTSKALSYMAPATPISRLLSRVRPTT